MAATYEPARQVLAAEMGDDQSALAVLFFLGDMAPQARQALAEWLLAEARPIGFRLCALPDDHPDADLFAVSVRWRSGDRWAVCHLNHCLSANGEWHLDHAGDDEWMAAHRFSLDVALELAREAVALVTIRGRSVADVLAETGTEPAWPWSTPDPGACVSSRRLDHGGTTGLCAGSRERVPVDQVTEPGTASCRACGALVDVMVKALPAGGWVALLADHQVPTWGTGCSDPLSGSGGVSL